MKFENSKQRLQQLVDKIKEAKGIPIGLERYLPKELKELVRRMLLDGAVSPQVSIGIILNGWKERVVEILNGSGTRGEKLDALMGLTKSVNEKDDAAGDIADAIIEAATPKHNDKNAKKIMFPSVIHVDHDDIPELKEIIEKNLKEDNPLREKLLKQFR